MSLVFIKVISAISVLGILVTVHEFGHFIVAKMCRVGVLKFAVGFGPAIFKFRRNETTYQIGIIPLGGFVRMVGDMPDLITGEQATDAAVREGAVVTETKSEPPEVLAVINDRSRWFIEKSLWQRAAVVFAGPLFNFIFAAVTVSICVLYYGARVGISAEVGGIVSGSPAEAAGLAAGDKVKKMNDASVEDWVALTTKIQQSKGEPIKFLVEREGKEIEITATPRERNYKTITGNVVTSYMIGINQPKSYIREVVSAKQAVVYGWEYVFNSTARMFLDIWGMIVGTVPADGLASPILIFQETGNRAEQGMEELIYFATMLSVSLGALNLLPIPVLDGGHLLFFLIEGLVGPISIRKKEFAQGFGMLLLLALMLFAVKNDLTRAPRPDPNEKKSWDSLAEPGSSPSSSPATSPNTSPSNSSRGVETEKSTVPGTP